MSELISISMIRKKNILISHMKFRILPFLSIILLGVLLSTPANGAVIWEYTFDTELSDDWRVSHGEVEVKDGVLETTECVEGKNDFCLASMWKNSTSLSGTWSLDYYRNSSSESEFLLYYASIGASSELLGDESGGWPTRGYCLFIFSNNAQEIHNIPELQFGLYSGSGCTGDSDLDYNLTSGWHHIEITRTNVGEMNLFIDGDHLGSVSRDWLDESEYVNLQLSWNDKLDNFTYSDTIDVAVPGGSTEIESDQSILYAYVPGLLGIVATGFASKRYKNKRSIKKTGEFLQQHSLIENLNGKSKNYHLKIASLVVGMQKKKESSILDQSNPILQYRFMLHPVRLVIMKSLQKNDAQFSSELRIQVGISWGDYRTHLRALEEKKYIEIREEFNENTQIAQKVYLTNLGRERFEFLISHLQEFILNEADNLTTHREEGSDYQLYPKDR